MTKYIVAGVVVFCLSGMSTYIMSIGQKGWGELLFIAALVIFGCF